jgi:hypothetical protein
VVEESAVGVRAMRVGAVGFEAVGVAVGVVMGVDARSCYYGSQF